MRIKLLFSLAPFYWTQTLLNRVLHFLILERLKTFVSSEILHALVVEDDHRVVVPILISLLLFEFPVNLLQLVLDLFLDV